MAKSVHISVRMSQAEAQQMRRLACQQGISVSTLLRQLVAQARSQRRPGLANRGQEQTPTV